MTDIRIIYTDKSGTLCVLTPADEMFDANSKTRKLLESNGIVFNNQAEILEFIINRAGLTGVQTKQINVSDLPSDRTFRNAWEISNGVVVHNLTKAKNIKKDLFRVLRKPLLEKLDALYMQADESNNTALKTQIAQKRQTLRDVTNLTLPDTIQELKDFMPAILTKTPDTI